MKIGIIGSNGYIAGYLKSKLNTELSECNIVNIDKTIDADLRYVDLADIDSIKSLRIDDLDYIVFTAAISSPDYCTEHFDEAWNINVTGTAALIDRAVHDDIRVLFFSSDAVFGNDTGHPFDEDSATCATTAYGKMKKAIEDRYSRVDCFKAIRLSYVASINDRFVKYCLKCFGSGEKVDVFHPFYRNCITVRVVTGVVAWLIKNWDTFEPQNLNVAGRELVSRLRIADEIERLLGNGFKYTVSQPNEEFFERHPAITQMTSKYLYDRKIIEDKSFTEYFRRELEPLMDKHTTD